MTQEALARAVADKMWQEDRATRDLGMRLDAVAPGAATLSMTIAEHMVNGLGICHGGFIFSLADSAMAFASNSHGEYAIAQHAAISFLRPGRLHQTLRAEAVERARAKRSAMYDVCVTGPEGVVAEFRGHTRGLGDRFFPAEG
ncbi:MAG TPA: hydroxyphenylacetyl-CoA thioesterase PaaI [Acetobacteraceae bacterium]